MRRGVMWTNFSLMRNSKKLTKKKKEKKTNPSVFLNRIAVPSKHFVLDNHLGCFIFVATVEMLILTWLPHLTMVIYNIFQEVIVSIKQDFPEVIITETFFSEACNQE